jgi:hypothetical protein
MPATPRDLLKPRQQRLSEVMTSAQLQAGQANAQQIIFGLTLEANAKTFNILAGEYQPDGVSQPIAIAAKAAIAVAAGAKTAAEQKCIVLVEINAAGEVFQTVSGLTTGTPVLPALTANRIAIGFIEVPAEFVPGTTTVTAGMLKAVKYSAGNTSPVAGF